MVDEKLLGQLQIAVASNHPRPQIRLVDMDGGTFRDVDALEFAVEQLTELTSRVVELEHSLSDAMEQIAAIQGSNAVHMGRAAELEDKLTRVAAQNASYYVDLLSRCNIITELEAKLDRLAESKEGGA